MTYPPAGDAQQDVGPAQLPLRHEFCGSHGVHKEADGDDAQQCGTSCDDGQIGPIRHEQHRRTDTANDFGESHGPAMGGVLDGMPPLVLIDLDAVRRDVARRRPGHAPGVSQRKESDEVGDPSRG